MYSKFFKRPLDLTLSTILLVMSSPLILTTSILLYFQNSGSVLFYQRRPGYNEKPFKIMKFKTMTDERDDNGELLPDNRRITGIGKWIRKLSLDELPQLFNVIKGDMSLVGPRPLLMDYLPYFTQEQMRRHDVRPGITGWAQVNGRNAIGWDQKLKLDLWYVYHSSLWLDIKILCLTFVKVVRREGIAHEGHVAMPRFDEYVKEKNR